MTARGSKQVATKRQIPSFLGIALLPIALMARKLDRYSTRCCPLRVNEDREGPGSPKSGRTYCVGRAAAIARGQICPVRIFQIQIATAVAPRGNVYGHALPARPAE